MEEERTKVERKIYTHEARKEWKKSAKTSLKKHYILLVLTVAVAGAFGVQKGYFVDSRPLSDSRGLESIEQQESGFEGTLIMSLISKDSNKTANETTANAQKFSKNLNDGNYDEAQKIADNESKKYKKGKVTNAVLGRKYGILAGVANDITSGTLLVQIVKAVNTVVKSSQLTVALLVLSAVIVLLLIWFFVINLYRAVMRRIFLEARLYEKVDPSHFFWFKSVGKWTKAAKSMFLMEFRLFLWNLTIVGGPIKYYSYWLVPFIIAENPDIDPKEAIRLSRMMMNGRKWEAFKYDVTFVGWEMLSFATFGFLQFFFVAPYKLASDTEFYAVIRKECKESRLIGIDQLNDYYLFEIPEKSLIERKYADIFEREKEIEAKRIRLSGAKKFFADNLGVWIGTTATQKEYEKYEAEALSIKKVYRCAEGEVYPARLNKLWEESERNIKLDKTKKMMREFNALRTYSVWDIIAMFFAFSFVGWTWEVMIHIVNDGEFVNRGTLHGPWLPIYGAGAILILLVLKRFRDRPPLEALSAVVLCGIVEYSTSYFLEVTKGTRWWDYTGYFLNINGRICAEGLLVFAIGGMAVVYIIAPALARMLSKIKLNILIPLCAVLVASFAGDMIYTHTHPNTGDGITSYSHYKEAAENS